MFEKKPELQKIHKALAEYADTLNRGDEMAMEKIETISGIERYSESWNHVVKTMKRHLFDSRGIVAWPKFNGSYSLLTEHEQATKLPRWRQIAARRRIRKAMREISAVDGSKLNTHDRLASVRQMEYMAHQSKQLYRGIHDGQPKKTQTLPRRTLVVA